VRYPGEHVLQIRKENMTNGIPVEAAIWREVQGLVETGALWRSAFTFSG